jgi:hypothetical protein
MFALALDIAARTIEAIAPVLIIVAVVVALGHAVWYFHSRRDGW